MRCIVSGFNPFGPHDFNPTEALVAGLPPGLAGEGGAAAALERVVLDTCCETAWDALSRALAAGEPGAEAPLVIMTGLAETARAVRLERFALNIQDYRIPDNAGHMWVDREIDAGCPAALRTALPLRDLEQHLTACGFLLEVSNHAGSFLCNEVYFRVLGWLAARKLPLNAVFVHFPPPEAYAVAYMTAQWDAGAPPLASTAEVIKHYSDLVCSAISYLLGRAV